MKLTLKRRNRRLAQTLETERFLLKPMGVIETLRLTAGWRKDPDILTGLYHSPRPRSLVEWIAKGPMPNNVDRFTFAIIDKATGTPIGCNGVRFCDYRSARFLVALRDRAWWGRGVVSEARIALINHFFRHAPVERFVGSLNGRNTASLFNYRRLGFDHVGTWHRHVQNPVTGEVLDLMLFELLREKWLASPLAAADLAAPPPSETTP